jgi:UDP-N-acetylmuramoyl-L-alanyl-D-glutamate--2,6-diaminopimelate ligase
VDNGRGLLVLVDYAHTEDALAHALAAVRPLTSGRLWVVFGCGGDRDRGKRPRMGAIAEAGADRVVLTSDNPRGEEPTAIAAEVLAGVRRPDRVCVALDRGDAIRLAIAEARAGDAILVAGKGHEATQEIAGQFHPFDDVAVCAAALSER